MAGHADQMKQRYQEFSQGDLDAALQDWADDFTWEGSNSTDLPGGGQQVELSPGFSVFWRQVPGGPLVLGNDQDAGSAPAATLVDSPAYQAFLDKAGVGDGTVNLYLDVPTTLSFLPDLPPDARPVGGVGMWSTKSGNTATTNLFVEIKG